MNDTVWPFDQPPEAKAVTTVGIVEDKLDITMVEHYEDDNLWGFFCGTTDKEEDARVITMQELLEIDPTLSAIAHIEPGQRAWRKARNTDWNIE